MGNFFKDKLGINIPVRNTFNSIFNKDEEERKRREQGMVFKVGEGLNPQQLKRAETVVSKPYTQPSTPGDFNFFKDFVKSIPASAQKVNQKAIVEPAQSIARNTASLGVSLYNNNSTVKKYGLTGPDTLQPDNFFHKAIFGDEEVKSIGLRSRENKENIQKFGEKYNVPILKNKYGAMGLGAVMPVLSIGLDLFGGGGKNKALSEVSKVVSKLDDISLIQKSLTKLGIGEDIAKDLSVALRTVNDEKIAENMITTAQKGFKADRVVQAVSKDGKIQDKFYLIPKDQADDIIKSIDGSQKGGIAGKVIDGLDWHITAKSPLQMERLGFKNAGSLAMEELDNVPKQLSKYIKSAVPIVEDPSLIDSFSNKIKNPIKFFKGDLKEFEANPKLLKIEEAKDRVLQELENSLPGRRIFIDGAKQGSTQDVFGIKSTFPQWIPGDLRNSATIKPVLKHIKDETLPTGSRQVELYNIIADRMGVKGPDGLSNTTTSLQKTLSPQTAKDGKLVPTYNANVPQISSEVKERGFLTSLKNKPETAEIFKDEVDNYSVLRNSDVAKKQREFINNDSAGANALAQSNDIGVEAQATRILMLEDAIAAGDYNEAKRIATMTNVSATEAGRAAQINALLGQHLDDPARALVTASNHFDGYIKKAKPKFEYQTNKYTTEVEKIHKEAVEQIIKDIPEIKQIEKKLSLAEQVAKKDYPPAEELASRITPYFKAKKDNPVKEMIATLYKLAKEQLPAKGKRVPPKAIDVISRALKDKETYKEVWADAQKIVREKYADDPKAIGLLEKYFDKTLRSGVTVHADIPVSQGQINQAVTQELKEQSIKLSDVVRDHYTKVDEARSSLVTKLVDKANIGYKDANALSSKIQARFNELTKARKESILKSIFSERVVKNDKGFVKKIVEMSNLGAFNKLEFREALAGKLGLPVLTDEVAEQIVKQSNVLQGMEKGYAKFKETQKLLKIISDAMPMTKAELAGEIINIPRTIMSSLDLSFGLRQGVFAAPTFRKEFGGAFKKQFGMFAQEKYYEDVMDTIIKDPNFDMAQKSGLALTDLGAPLAQREEAFMSSFAERIPVLGRGIRMSARAYTGMANKMRMDMFNSMINNAELVGKDITDPFLQKSIATFVNAATGRGGLGVFEKIAPVLNGILFSPRLMSSRLKLLTDFANPYYYKHADPFVMKQQVKSLLAFTGTVSSVLTMAKLAGAEVGIDPRSADFGKIKIGGTRIDVMGGFQQYIRMAGQLITGEYISSTSGKLTTLGEGYKPLTRWDILWRQIENKEAPVASFITNMLRQQDYQGKPIKIQKEILDRFTPMVAGAFMDIAKEDPELLPLGLLGIFGFGVQSYGKPEDLKLLDQINNSPDPGKAFEDLYNKDPKMAEKVEKAKSEENYTDFDWKVRGKGVENGERTKMIWKELQKLKTDEEKGKLWGDLMEKKIITDKVEEQLLFLIENPDYKIPESE